MTWVAVPGPHTDMTQRMYVSLSESTAIAERMRATLAVCRWLAPRKPPR